MRILCIVPAGHEADYLHKGLKELAYGLDVVHNLDDGVFYCAETAYDALIVALDDVNLTMIEQLVVASRGARLIVIATEDSSALRTAVLRAGADACLTRPWSFMELQARLQVLERRSAAASSAHSSTHAPVHASATRKSASSVTRRAPAVTNDAGTSLSTETAPPSRPALKADAYRLDPASRSLIAPDAAVSLSRREYLVLECLMRDPDAAISRDQLLGYAWTADEHADTSTVNTLISRLRAKASAAGVALPLETVVGHGYRFLGKQP
ncbi:MAG TPA: response regulator transcription factor [Pararobbsia sp.]|nr:response regulator transcription factor [Pararobbsia sp.]